MHKFTFFECCHLFPPMSEVFFSPTQLALFVSRFPPLFNYTTRVCQTQVCLGQVSTNLSYKNYPSVGLVLTISKSEKFTITLCFTACIAKPTAWKRGCGKVKSTPLCTLSLRACLSFSTQVHMAANVGPKSTIKINYLYSSSFLYNCGISNKPVETPVMLRSCNTRTVHVI